MKRLILLLALLLLAPLAMGKDDAFSTLYLWKSDKTTSTSLTYDWVQGLGSSTSNYIYFNSGSDFLRYNTGSSVFEFSKAIHTDVNLTTNGLSLKGANIIDGSRNMTPNDVTLGTAGGGDRALRLNSGYATRYMTVTSAGSAGTGAATVATVGQDLTLKPSHQINLDITGTSMVRVRDGSNSAIKATLDRFGRATLAGLGVSTSTLALPTITSTDAGFDPAALDLYRNSASPANNDALAAIQFSGKDDAAGKKVAARIVAVATGVPAATYAGRLDFRTLLAGTEATPLSVSNAGAAVTGLTVSGKTVFAALTKNLTAATDALSGTDLNATYIALNPSQTLSLSSTPTIADGTTGQVLILTNPTSYNVTLTDEGEMPGSNIQVAGGVAITLGRNDVLTVIYDGTDWVTQSYSNN